MATATDQTTEAGPSWRAEIGPMLRLAMPVVLAEIGWSAMGLVDTLMVGPLGAAAIGAVGLGNILFFTPAIFGMGLLFGLDTVISQAYGAGHRRDCRRWLLQGLYLCAAMTPALMALVWYAGPIFGRIGQHEEVLRYTLPYMRIVTWSAGPLLVFTALRRYVQAVNRVRPAMVALVSANLVNLVVNWSFIHGHFGMPRLGVPGAAWATLLSRCYMMAYLAVDVWIHTRRERSESGEGSISLAPDWTRLRRLIGLGLPAAVHITLEVAVFGVATAMAGVFGPAALAAHQIALNICGLTFMVPLGVSTAAAVRVGHALGRRDPAGAAVSGWTGLGIGVGFMAVAATVFLIAPRTIIGAFTDEHRVLTTGIGLLAVAAAFQLFDGLQVVATGALRGAGDTRTPMIVNFVAHWLLALPIGYLLGVQIGWGVQGLWMGLSVGLIVAGLVLLHAWALHARHLDRDALAASAPEGE